MEDNGTVFARKSRSWVTNYFLILFNKKPKKLAFFYFMLYNWKFLINNYLQKESDLEFNNSL